MANLSERTITIAAACAVFAVPVWVVDTISAGSWITKLLHSLSQQPSWLVMIAAILVAGYFWAVIRNLHFAVYVWRRVEWRAWALWYGFAAIAVLGVALIWGHNTFLDAPGGSVALAWLFEAIWLLIFAVSPLGNLLLLTSLAIRRKPFPPPG